VKNGTNEVVIKFWDNEACDYPIVVVNQKDLNRLKFFLEEYQKDDEYNFDG